MLNGADSTLICRIVIGFNNIFTMSGVAVIFFRAIGSRFMYTISSVISCYGIINVVGDV